MAHKVVVQVRGSRPFPLDMLRYDSLVPASEADSTLIQRSIAEPYDGVVEVTLARWMQSRRDATSYVSHLAACERSTNRWSSFGWDVVKVEAVTW